MKFVHEYDRDAQALYGMLLEAYQHGIQAELPQEKIQEEIQNLRLTSSWPQTFEYFLVTFEHKLLDLELITNTPISYTDKRKWHISSIRGMKIATVLHDCAENHWKRNKGHVI